jgi:hypothetical protein
MFGSGGPDVMAQQYLLDALGTGCSDALVDTECLPQVSDACACVAVLEVATADAFQGACFLQRRTDGAGNGKRLFVVVGGLLAACGTGRQFTEAVEGSGLLVSLPEVAEQTQRLLVAGRGGRVVAS